ncbi:hypothetical protein V8C37DRAFT_379905 [Trichoderma ceciliae]
MQFKCLALLTFALSSHQAHAALSANDVVNGIHNITDLSSGALDTVKDITPANVLPSALVCLNLYPLGGKVSSLGVLISRL